MRQLDVVSVVFGVPPILMYPVYVCYGLLQVIVYDFCLSNGIEGVDADNEGSDAFYKINHFYKNLTK